MDRKTERDLVIVAFFTLIFSIASSVLSYRKYISFNDSVYDLGVSSDLIKNALTSPIAYNKLIYVFNSQSQVNSYFILMYSVISVIVTGY